MNRRNLLGLLGLSPVVAVTAASAKPASIKVGDLMTFAGDPKEYRVSGSVSGPPAGIDARGAMLTEAQFRAILDENNARLRAELPGYIASQRRRCT